MSFQLATLLIVTVVAAVAGVETAVLVHRAISRTQAQAVLSDDDWKREAERKMQEHNPYVVLTFSWRSCNTQGNRRTGIVRATHGTLGADTFFVAGTSNGHILEYTTDLVTALRLLDALKDV
jgi:hypothetical protein